jgi:hypothetical protein
LWVKGHFETLKHVLIERYGININELAWFDSKAKDRYENKCVQTEGGKRLIRYVDMLPCKKRIFFAVGENYSLTGSSDG